MLPHKLTFLPESAPGVTIDGFNNMPSKSTLLSARYLKVWAQISSATSAVLHMEVVVYKLFRADLCSISTRLIDQLIMASMGTAALESKQ